ncbi:hypothetical protein ACQ4LE_005034 [Meloidogyne hapla]
MEDASVLVKIFASIVGEAVFDSGFGVKSSLSSATGVLAKIASVFFKEFASFLAFASETFLAIDLAVVKVESEEFALEKDDAVAAASEVDLTFASLVGIELVSIFDGEIVAEFASEFFV